MRWHIDAVEPQHIRGWIYALHKPELDIRLVAITGKKQIIARTTANLPRPDVLQRGHSKNACGFILNLPAGIAHDDLFVLCADINNLGLILHAPDKSDIGSFFPAYQTFEGEEEKTSPSAAKLETLRLPPLEGLSVLDLGCNEGFFSLHAYRNGARRVLGIDKNSWSLEKAKTRALDYESLEKAKTLEFRHSSWWELPEEKFDLILFLSAVHYEPEQKRLFDFLLSRLTDNGLLVLECGMIQGYPLHYWLDVERGNNPLRFPTQEYLYNTLLSSYAVRPVGKSPPLGGENVTRYVLHCQPRRPIVALVRGQSGSGKSTFAWLLRTEGVAVFSSDDFFSYALGHYPGPYREHTPQKPLYEFLRREIKFSGLGGVIHKIHAAGFLEEFCAEFISFLPLDHPLVVVEGEIFTDDLGYVTFKTLFEKKGFIIWSIRRE
jgi:SAM-dependent methyltransferase